MSVFLYNDCDKIDISNNGDDKMIYAMSDLHGCYDKYEKMIERINFSKNDTLYILGDVVDRGKDGIKILFDMMKRKNIIPILGNHDFTAFLVLKYIHSEKKPDWWNQIRADWLSDGGTLTENAFIELEKNRQKAVLDYIVNFSIYETVKINGNTFVLTHAGIDNFEKDKSLDEYELYDFISGRMDYNKVYSDDFYLVSGHTPTGLIDKACDGKIYRKNNHIAIDCGAFFERPLGCICFDTMEELYVE